GDIGINGKNSEFHAAMGLCCFDDLESIMLRRKEQWLYYRDVLTEISGIKLLKIHPDIKYNYSYFPVVFDSEGTMFRVIEALNANYIIPRRYFFPSLNKLKFLEKPEACPISESISSKIICLPLYHDLKIHEQDLIVSILKKHLS